MALLRGGAFRKFSSYNSAYSEINVWTGVVNCLCAHQSYFGVYFLGGQVLKKKMNAKITLKWAYEQFIITVNILLYYFFLHDIMDPEMTIKRTIFTHRLCVPFTLITFSWWHHCWLHNALSNPTIVLLVPEKWYHFYSRWYFRGQLCKKKRLLISNSMFWYF